MKEPHIEGLATHDDPESCACAREDVCEALTGARAGRVLSLESDKFGSADVVHVSGRQHGGTRYASVRPTPRGRRPLACAEPPGARTGRSTARPPRWRGGPRRERQGGNPTMHGPWKSDEPVVLTKLWNNAGKAAADGVEGRGSAKGNTPKHDTCRTQSRRSS